MIGEDVLHEAVTSRRGDLEGAARSLVAAANRVGGEDNITVVLFEIVADGAADTQAYEPVAPSPATADEDTLDELDAVPVVDVEAADVTSVGSQQSSSPAAAEPPKARRHGAGRGSRWPALLALVLALGVVAALVVWGVLR
jgi:hypothetical protein